MDTEVQRERMTVPPGRGRVSALRRDHRPPSATERPCPGGPRQAGALLGTLRGPAVPAIAPPVGAATTLRQMGKQSQEPPEAPQLGNGEMRLQTQQ